MAALVRRWATESPDRVSSISLCNIEAQLGDKPERSAEVILPFLREQTNTA